MKPHSTRSNANASAPIAQDFEFSHLRDQLVKIRFDDTSVYLSEETAWDVLYEMAAFLAQNDEKDYPQHDDEMDDDRIRESKRTLSLLQAYSSPQHRKYYS